MYKIIFTAILVSICNIMLAQNYVVISNESRLFDQPNVKSYPTTNTSGVNVILSPGMIFKQVGEAQNGWIKVEYTPGLNAFMLQSQTATTGMLSVPSPGKYKISNDSEKTLSIARNGNEWTANDGDQIYASISTGNESMLVFPDQFGNPIYSVTDLNGEIIVVCYKNDLTKFF